MASPRPKERFLRDWQEAQDQPVAGSVAATEQDSVLAAEPSDIESALRCPNLRARTRALLWRYRIPSCDQEDLLQDALLAMVRAGEGVAHRERWLLGTARNLCAEYHRRRKCWERLVEFVDPETLCSLTPLIDPPQSSAEASHDLSKALILSQLTPHERTMIRLRFEQGLASWEIASRIGCHEGNVRKATAKALARLRQAFEALAALESRRRSRAE